MGENEFWIKLWKYILIFVCTVIVLSVSSCQSTNYQIRKMVESGVTPMQAACAFQLGNTETGVCYVELMRNK